MLHASLGTRRSLKRYIDFEQKQNSPPFVSTDTLVAEIQKLEKSYSPIRGDFNWKALILLQYQHANLNAFARFLGNFTRLHVEPRSRDFDPRSSKLRGWVLREMARDSYLYRELTNISNQMTDTLESLIDVNKSLLAGNAKCTERFLILEPELRGCCKDVRGSLIWLTEEMDSNLKFLELARSIRQANDVQLLTVLAAIFLPLSLAAGGLSMQSRFKDLGVLIYDFFGVVLLLATAAILIIFGLVIWGIIQETASMVVTGTRAQLLWKLLIIFAGMTIVFNGAVILVSFLVGMFKDVALGAKILGYSFAAIIGAPIAFTILGLVVTTVIQWMETFMTFFKSRMSCTSRKRKQKDPERESGPDSQPQYIQQTTPEK